MRTLCALLIPALLTAQNYASYSTYPVARPSFLHRGQAYVPKLNVLADSSLLGWWILNDSQFTTSADASGNSKTATWNGTAPHVGNGKMSAFAASLNGTNNYVAVSSLTNPATFTVMGWVYLTAAAPSFMRVMDASYATNWLLGAGSGGSTWALIVVNGTAACTGGTPATGVWTHIAGTYNGTVGNLYVNGAAVATSCSMTSPGTQTSNMNIGTSQPASGGYVQGSLQDMRVYNRVLAQAEIQAIYNAENH